MQVQGEAEPAPKDIRLETKPGDTEGAEATPAEEPAPKVNLRLETKPGDWIWYEEAKAAAPPTIDHIFELTEKGTFCHPCQEKMCQRANSAESHLKSEKHCRNVSKQH